MDRSPELFEYIGILSGSKFDHDLSTILPPSGALASLVQRMSSEVYTNIGLLEKMEKLWVENIQSPFRFMMWLHSELIGESLVMIRPWRCQHLPRNFKRFSPIFKRIFNSSSRKRISMYVRFLLRYFQWYLNILYILVTKKATSEALWYYHHLHSKTNQWTNKAISGMGAKHMSANFIWWWRFCRSSLIFIQSIFKNGKNEFRSMEARMTMYR